MTRPVPTDNTGASPSSEKDYSAAFDTKNYSLSFEYRALEHNYYNQNFDLYLRTPQDMASGAKVKEHDSSILAQNSIVSARSLLGEIVEDGKKKRDALEGFRAELDRLELNIDRELAREEYARRASSAGSDSAFDPGMASRILGKEIVENVIEAQTDEQKARAFAETLKDLSAEKRKQALEKYYANRKPWAEKRTDLSTPKDFLDWADTAFPFRSIIGLRFNDLAHLDGAAHSKIKNWLKDGSGVTVPDDRFGFPKKNQTYDPAQLQNAPAASEVHEAFKRGDPKAPEMKRLNAAAGYHLK